MQFVHGAFCCLQIYNRVSGSLSVPEQQTCERLRIYTHAKEKYNIDFIYCDRLHLNLNATHVQSGRAITAAVLVIAPRDGERNWAN